MTQILGGGLIERQTNAQDASAPANRRFSQADVDAEDVWVSHARLGDACHETFLGFVVPIFGKPVNLRHQGVIVKDIRHLIFGNEHPMASDAQGQVQEVNLRAVPIQN